MYRFKNYIACLLLLLFMRVMAPEAVLLQWHSHEHTKEELGKTATGFAISKKHTHCYIDNLFNAPFVPAQIIPLKAVLIPFTDTYSVHNSFAWKFTFPNNTDLRGPPQV